MNYLLKSLGCRMNICCCIKTSITVQALSTPPGTSSPSLHLPAELPTPVTVSSSPPLSKVPAGVAQLLLDCPGVVNPSKQLRQQSMTSNITSRLLGHLLPPDSAALRAQNSRRPEQSLTRWRRTVLCASLQARGHLLSTWCQRRMVPGGLAAIFGG